jgi:hypothetical protein
MFMLMMFLLVVDVPGHALHYPQEFTTWPCCNNGHASGLPRLPEVPLELLQLYVLQDTRGRTFRKEIKKYNNAVAFTHTRMNLELLPGGGPQVIRT